MDLITQAVQAAAVSPSAASTLLNQAYNQIAKEWLPMHATSAVVHLLTQTPPSFRVIGGPEREVPEELGETVLTAQRLVAIPYDARSIMYAACHMALHDYWNQMGADIAVAPNMIGAMQELLMAAWFATEAPVLQVSPAVAMSTYYEYRLASVVTIPSVIQDMIALLRTSPVELDLPHEGVDPLSPSWYISGMNRLICHTNAMHIITHYVTHAATM